MSSPTSTQQHIAQLSQHLDAMETLADNEFFSLAGGSPQALENVLARLQRLQLTIELAADA